MTPTLPPRVHVPASHPTTSALFFYVLGKLSEPHAAAIDRHLRHCRRCRPELTGVENDAADLALALAPVPVPPLMRETLLHSVREVHRLSDTIPTLQRALGCSMAEAQTVLAKVDVPSHWRRKDRAWELPLGGRSRQRAAIVRLSLDARYGPPARRRGRVHVLQGHARTSFGPLRAGRTVQVPARACFAAYPGPDVLLLFTWPHEIAPPQNPPQVISRRRRTSAPAETTGPTGSG